MFARYSPKTSSFGGMVGSKRESDLTPSQKVPFTWNHKIIAIVSSPGAARRGLACG